MTNPSSNGDGADALPEWLNELLKFFETLADEERRVILSHFCRGCGARTESCHCQKA